MTTNENRSLRRVLVTGATGFLGLRTVDMLLEAGYIVRALVRQSSDTRALRQRDVEIVVGSLAPASGLEEALRGVDAVVHSAGGGQHSLKPLSSQSAWMRARSPVRIRRSPRLRRRCAFLMTDRWTIARSPARSSRRCAAPACSFTRARGFPGWMPIQARRSSQVVRAAVSTLSSSQRARARRPDWTRASQSSR